MTDSPLDRIRRGYDDRTAEQEQAARISADLAQMWRHDGALERTRAQVDAGQRIDPTTRLSLAYYEQNKTAAKSAGLPTAPPDNAA